MLKRIIFYTLLFSSLHLMGQTKPSPKTTATAKKPIAKTTTPAGKVAFSITGKLEGLKNHLVVLNKFMGNSLTLIDSTSTDAEGNFKFKKSIAAPCIAYLQYNASSAVPIIIENGSIFNISVKSMQNSLDYAITGTKVEKSINLYNFIKRHSDYYSELAELERTIQVEENAMKMQEAQFKYMNTQKAMNTNVENGIKNYSPLESYFIFYNFIEEKSMTDAKSIMTRMEPRDIKSEYYKDLKKMYETNKSLEVGEMAPDINLPTPFGDTLRLSSLRGKVVLIDFWASWCGPCRAEFPNVKRIYGLYKDKGFEIYGVSLDKEAVAWTSSIASLALPWKHVSDLKYWNCAPAKVYKVSSIPYTVLIGKDGKIIAKNLRGEALELKLEELFQ